MQRNCSGWQNNPSSNAAEGEIRLARPIGSLRKQWLIETVGIRIDGLGHTRDRAKVRRP